MKHETVLVMDFGGQYNQLIARRVRELNVFCEMISPRTTLEEILKKEPKGIIFTGGPYDVFKSDSPKADKRIYDAGIPILGICYGCQLIAYENGGNVTSEVLVREYGKSGITYTDSTLFKEMEQKSVCWMSHTNYVNVPPKGFKITAVTENCPVGAMENEDKKIYGVQFHPEVMHTKNGMQILKNFLYGVCKLKGDWTMSNFVNENVSKLKEKIQDKKVLCAMSGGVDSAVAATIVHRACGNNLTCIFVDHGLLRKNEAEEVVKVFKDGQKMNLIKVDAKDRFLNLLKGVSDPEEKRKIIGNEFIKVFEEEAKKIGKVDFLVQGTIYPDVVESGYGYGAKIKSHHNVGGLPDVVDFKEIVEPLRDLFKDEVRRVGFELGLPKEIVMRQPFPGPGLAIRVMGDINDYKLSILKEADYIFREEIAKNGLDEEIWQYFAVLTNLRSVGVMGDERTYDYAIALRAVTSVDGMTADFAKIPYNVLEIISNRIVNEVQHVNRVVYDITTKPPATIEFE